MKKLPLFFVSVLCFALVHYGQTGNTYPAGQSSRNPIPDAVKARKSFKRVEWFNTQRAWPLDTIPMARYTGELRSEINKIKSHVSKEKNFTWTSLGPTGINFDPVEWGIVSGRAKTIAVHPADPETLYIGTAHGGIWKSTDGGQTWQDIGHGLESMAFGAIAIDPNNPETIYAGSGEVCYFLGFIGFDGKGIFKSTDGGTSWTQITNGIGDVTSFGDLAVSPFNSNVVLGALASGNYYSGNLPNEGVWKSDDAGETWVRTLAVQDAFDIAFHPTDASKVYAAVGGGNIASGIYISTDQGDTWALSNTGLPPMGSMHRLQIDISQSNPDVIYAVIFDANTMSTKAYKSVNGGQNWAQIAVGNYLGGNYGDGWGDQGFYDLCIAVDPENENLVYIGNIELHRTMNGSAFVPVRPYGAYAWGSLCHVDYHKLAFAPSNPDYLYIACDGGIYKSTNKGNSATSQNQGLETLQFYRVASHPTDPGIVIGGMQDNGTAMTTDGGLIWNEVTSGDGMECIFSPNPDTIYTAAQNGYFFRSINGGNSFNFMANINGSWITPLIMHPVNHQILYTANTSILKSTTGGAPFLAIASNVSPEFIVSLALSPVHPDHMIFASGGTQSPVPGSIIVVKVSTDGGYNWTDVTANIPGEPRWITRVLADPVDANTMYILRTGFSAGNKVWKTTDLGLTWTNLSGDLPDLPCSDLFIDPENTSHMYVGNDIGVYRSTDGGQAWNYISQDIPFVPAIDFDYVKIGTARYLRVGTHGRSIYETILPNYCLPEGITFTTQEQIDNFQANYPGCTEIEGDVTISGQDISNLNGLNVLSSIGGTLYIGINNVGNQMLTSLTGLENLISIVGNLDIGGIGLVGSPNPVLNSLTGLDNLTSIGGDLIIYNNPVLTSLTGLDGVTSIGGALFIHDNGNLTSCAAQSICDYLTGPNGVVDIFENGPGCNSQSEVATDCGGSISCLPYGNYYFLSQTDLDNFQLNFPGCTELEGNLAISGNPITNLTGLNQLVSIGGNADIITCDNLNSLSGMNNLSHVDGNLNVSFNDLLVNFSGLDNLNSIGGSLDLHENNQLISLSGLENLDSIGGWLGIGTIYNIGVPNPPPGGNDLLVNLNPLESLTYVGEGINIGRNGSLSSLAGLENINANTVTDLLIGNNFSLSTCHVQSVCDYLSSPNGTIEIENNAPGCNSVQEVEDACNGVGTPEVQSSEFKVQSYPNPTGGKIDFRLSVFDCRFVSLKVYDVHGREVAVILNQDMPAGDHTVQWDASLLPAGIYFYRTSTIDNRQSAIDKIVKY